MPGYHPSLLLLTKVNLTLATGYIYKLVRLHGPKHVAPSNHLQLEGRKREKEKMPYRLNN